MNTLEFVFLMIGAGATVFVLLEDKARSRGRKVEWEPILRNKSNAFANKWLNRATSQFSNLMIVAGVWMLVMSLWLPDDQWAGTVMDATVVGLTALFIVSACFAAACFAFAELADPEPAATARE